MSCTLDIGLGLSVWLAGACWARQVKIIYLLACSLQLTRQTDQPAYPRWGFGWKKVYLTWRRKSAHFWGEVKILKGFLLIFWMDTEGLLDFDFNQSHKINWKEWLSQTVTEIYCLNEWFFYTVKMCVLNLARRMREGREFKMRRNESWKKMYFVISLALILCTVCMQHFKASSIFSCWFECHWGKN